MLENDAQIFSLLAFRGSFELVLIWRSGCPVLWVLSSCSRDPIHLVYCIIKTYTATISPMTGRSSKQLVSRSFTRLTCSDCSRTVYGVLFIETVQTGLNGLDLHYWFISGYGNLKHIASPYASAFDVPIIESIVSLVVEFFFAYRIWILSVKKARLLCLLICLVRRSQTPLKPAFKCCFPLIVLCDERSSSIYYWNLCN